MKSAETVLEIGVYKGHSIKLWYDYFVNATIYGIDIKNKVDIPEIINNNRVVLYLHYDAYNDLFVKQKFFYNKIKFNFY